MFRRTQSGEPAVHRCSFCRKSQDDVRKLIAGVSANICDECVDVCLDIMRDDRQWNYNYPAGWTTHDVFLTTTATWGDGATKTVETYGRQGPREVWMAQQLFLGLLYDASWTREFRKAKCGLEE